MPYTGTPKKGVSHGPSVKNPAAYEAMVRDGMSKGRAAAISNAALNKGYRKGEHRGRSGRQGKKR